MDTIRSRGPEPRSSSRRRLAKKQRAGRAGRPRRMKTGVPTWQRSAQSGSMTSSTSPVGRGCVRVETWPPTQGAAVSVSLDYIDVVVEGAARKVTDPDTLERGANVYASLGWPARVSAGAITAEFSAPSAGRGPWDLYAVTPSAAVGVATREPFDATRWRFK